MNKKKISLLIASIVMGIIFFVIPNKAQASTPLTTPLYYGIQEYRNNTDPANLAYAIYNPEANGSTGDPLVGAKIWQIVKYNDSTATGTYTTGNYYCVRAGYGFSDTKKSGTYNISYDLKSDKDEILATTNNGLNNIISNGYYNNLLALADLLYLPGVSTTTERTALLTNAGIYADDYEYPITDGDIEAVQQAAIWYFTNHDETVYDNYHKASWLFYKILSVTNNYASFSDYERATNAFGGHAGKGYDRQNQAVLLYDYLIETANANAAAYTAGTAVSNTKITLYSNATEQNTQPIILIERIQETREFDLSLRKYITKVDDTVLSGADSRVPVIGESTIADEKTATYKHKKDPVVATNGSVITYNITVYNEGEKAGRATKIVDQLPVGLEFSKLNTEGFTASYDETKNLVTITRNADNTENLAAYAENDLKSETIEIECIVTANANTTSDIVLKNVAWIAEEYDAVDGVTIIDETDKDRDSEPGTAPNVNKTTVSSYLPTGNKVDLSDSTYFYKGQQDDDDFENVIIEKLNDGLYNIILVKENEDGNQLNSEASFEINGTTKQVTGMLEIASNVQITSENVNTPDTYVIKELVAPNKYCKFDGIITLVVAKKEEDGVYKVDRDNCSYTITDSNGTDIKAQSADAVTININNNGNIYVKVKNYQFDLKLVKRIVEVNGVRVPERLEGIDITNLANGTETTAAYTVNKNPTSVKNGDIIKYTLRIYNEGSIDGYASEISEDIPEGLELVWSEMTDAELEADTTISDLEKQAIRYNQLIWSFKTVNTQTNKVELITTDYLAKGKGLEVATDGANLIKAFDKTKQYTNVVNDKNPDYKEVSVYMKVVSEDTTGSIIRNEAAITGDTDKNGNSVTDRDSIPEEWVKYEDDEDYDNIILKSFDLALRKFIIAVSKDTNIEASEYLRDSTGSYLRAPIVDTSKLNTIGSDGKIITTAIYNQPKEPVSVVKNDVVVYMIRAYNEGDIDGYASEITDHLPVYLQYINNEFNQGYGWKVSKDGRTVVTNYLENSVIKKVEVNEDDEVVLSYREVPIMCKVTEDAIGKITNIADVTECKDESKQIIKDRDSEVKNVVLPSDNDLPTYKDNETGSYIPGQQDDDDFEKVIVRIFDLALRKFITAVNDEKVTTRVPYVVYDEDDNKIEYKHSKDPVDVSTTDIVTYTIRVFNEGEIDGYASEVADDIPDGLEFLPDNSLNKEYRWLMYDKDGNKTDDISKAVRIKTDYLSKEQGATRSTTNGENPALLKAFDKEAEISETNPDYADVKVAFKVVEKNTTGRIIINSAEITDDTDKDGNSIDDEDSTTDKWIEGDDDQDQEFIKLNYFDLALRKWVTQAIVIENGTETVTQTGHKAEDDPEQVVKVEINKKKLSSVIVKFKYSIRVTNEGDIAGYAKEITDYVPEGLKFVSSDNQDWKDEGNNIISTRKLENTLLQPGESAEVEVILTWINGSNNLGLKVNIAEISEDYNEKGIKDRDSTPDNKIPEEDDQDDAPVILSVSTGQTKIYYVLGFSVLISTATGIILIKKFVL